MAAALNVYKMIHLKSAVVVDISINEPYPLFSRDFINNKTVTVARHHFSKTYFSIFVFCRAETIYCMLLSSQEAPGNTMKMIV